MRLILTPRIAEPFPILFTMTYEHVISFFKTNDMYTWATSYGLNTSLHEDDILYIEIIDNDIPIE